MKNVAKLVINKLPKLKISLDKLTKQEVLVGVPRDKTVRQAGEAESMNNATLAYIHDKGSPANNIPARPFMEPGIENAKPKVVLQFKKAAQKAVAGDESAIDKELHSAGLLAQAAIRNKINEGIAPSLAPSTLATRRRRGRKGDKPKPLVDTGQLRNNINYVIRNK